MTPDLKAYIDEVSRRYVEPVLGHPPPEGAEFLRALDIAWYMGLRAFSDSSIEETLTGLGHSQETIRDCLEIVHDLLDHDEFGPWEE